MHITILIYKGATYRMWFQSIPFKNGWFFISSTLLAPIRLSALQQNLQYQQLGYNNE